MDLNTFIREFEMGARQLPGELIKAYETTAMAAKAIIQNRIQENGLDSSGAPLRPYSTKYLAFKKGEGENPYPGEPKKLPSNRFSGHVDYTLTGRMWNNLGILNSEFTESGILVSLGAQTSDNDAKVENLSDLREDIFLMTHDEQDNLLPEILDEELQKIVDQLFLTHLP